MLSYFGSYETFDDKRPNSASEDQSLTLTEIRKLHSSKPTVYQTIGIDNTAASMYSRSGKSINKRFKVFKRSEDALEGI